MSKLLRRKAIRGATGADQHGGLKRTLSWPHLVALGVGAIVGTGILTLIGKAAGLAGPAVLLSFGIAGFICACAALAYAEMSTMLPGAGSAYSYSYAVLGEVFAWVIGWSLILEYSLVVSAVAVGWSGYASPLLHDWIGYPMEFAKGPEVGGVINLPAIFIIMVVTGLLILGTRESARLNAALVVIKIATLALFVAVALPYFNAENLDPFMPFGFGKTTGADQIERGVMAAAAIIFFAFYGFDAISTAAEETKNPDRNLPIGIIGSMVACTIIYMVVALAAVGTMPFGQFASSPEPLAHILRALGQPDIARIVAAAASIALPTVLLAFLYGQSRIFLAMARDGFLPPSLARIGARGTPVRITLITAVLVSIIAGLLPIDEIAALANSGTLAAFAAVALCMLVMRRRAPNARRPFRTPAPLFVGMGAIFGCAYLFWSLPSKTQLYFLIWNGIGLLVYFGYGMRKSLADVEEGNAA